MNTQIFLRIALYPVLLVLPVRKQRYYVEAVYENVLFRISETGGLRTGWYVFRWTICNYLHSSQKTFLLDFRLSTDVSIPNPIKHISKLRTQTRIVQRFNWYTGRRRSLNSILKDRQGCAGHDRKILFLSSMYVDLGIEVDPITISWFDKNGGVSLP